MRLVRVLIVAALLMAAPAAASASNADTPGRHVTRWDETLTLHEDGSMDVRLEIDFDFGNDPGHGPYLVLVTRQGYDENRDRLYPTSDIRASSPTGAPAQVNLDEGENFIDIKIGDPNIDDVSGVQTYVLTYSVRGVVNHPEGGQADDAAQPDEFLWNAVGDGWTIPISNASVSVIAPASALNSQCFAGRPGSSDSCDAITDTGTSVGFTQDELSPGQPFTVDIQYQDGTFSGGPIVLDHQDLTRAFTLNAVTLGAAGAILLAGVALLTWKLRSTATDEQFVGLIPGMSPVVSYGDSPSEQAPTQRRDYKTPVAVRFEPPTGLRPGQLGTLIDEKADTRDVTATLVDLAVRGYVRIDDAGETQTGLFSKTPDYRLVRLRPSDAALFPYEAVLLDTLFQSKTEVTLSALKTTFASSMARVQKELYANVTLLGWFKRNPQAARALWAAVGIVVLLVGAGATVGLAQQSNLALIPTPLVLLGAMVLATTTNAPARTAAGTAALEQARGFELYITKAEANQLRFEEGEDLFSKYLPYAIAFGVADKWAKKFEQLASEGRVLAEPTWYGSGLAYGAFWANAGGLGDRMAQFASVADAAMAAPTPGSSGGSGFSGGGGFAGGGGGGGGGGGW